MNARIVQIKEKIQPIREQIVDHPLFSKINSIEDIQTFMQFHVYAVWDFMSLLKALQQQLTCTDSPWFPKGNANTRYLINEIVVGEECDLNSVGERKSHFEMYMDAMEQVNAPINRIVSFCESLQQSADFTTSYSMANTPLAAQSFVNFTFETIATKKDYLQAAIFTFGREDLIPNMFYSLVSELNERFPNQISQFKYYLDRHIEIDGDHHSHLSIEMMEQLCGDDQEKWKEAETFILLSLEQRKKLWDGVLEAIQKS
jgi:hypothetical protein